MPGPVAPSWAAHPKPCWVPPSRCAGLLAMSLAPWQGLLSSGSSLLPARANSKLLSGCKLSPPLLPFSPVTVVCGLFS